MNRTYRRPPPACMGFPVSSAEEWGELRSAVQDQDPVRLTRSLHRYFGRGVRRPEAEVAYAVEAWFRMEAGSSRDDLPPREEAVMMLWLEDPLRMDWKQHPDRLSMVRDQEVPRDWTPLPETGLWIPTSDSDLLRAEALSACSWAREAAPEQWRWMKLASAASQDRLREEVTLEWLIHLLRDLLWLWESHRPFSPSATVWVECKAKLQDQLSLAMLASETTLGPRLRDVTRCLLEAWSAPCPAARIAYRKELRKHLLQSTPPDLLLDSAMRAWALT
jgi:hypothetical protein